MIKKDSCQECGRLVNSNKIHQSRIDYRKLCSYCYNSENKTLLNDKLDRVFGPLDNTIKNPETLTREAKNLNTGYLKRDELDFMKSKHGSNASLKIKRLKCAMKESGRKSKSKIKDKSDSLNKKELNKKLLDGLK
jgi:hypothetical protein